MGVVPATTTMREKRYSYPIVRALRDRVFRISFVSSKIQGSNGCWRQTLGESVAIPAALTKSRGADFAKATVRTAVTFADV